MQRRWREKEIRDPALVETLRRDLNSLPEALARLLVLRGVRSMEDARLFFRGSLQELPDPFLMRDMDAAADRLAEAVVGRERVLVFGDYDVDGTTATALLTLFLRGEGVPVAFHVPDRITEGYGLNRGAVDLACSQGAGIIVALDCGVTAIDVAAYARERRVDLIICDHHTPGPDLPAALAVLDPKRSDCLYPFKELSGCGVGYKLVTAVLTRLGRDVREADSYLDLVAISCASDIVPVNGENRILMKEGFRRIDEAPRPGISALAEQARLVLSPCNTGRIVFGIGPRINAAGRMTHARHAVNLLLATSHDEAAPIAAGLEAANHRRRLLDEQILAQAIERVEAIGPESGYVLYDPEWHPGVIGIVASRIVERFYRPTVMLGRVNGVVKGSARSIAGVNIYRVLSQCSDLLLAFGGHDYAAGLSLAEERVDEFARRFAFAVGEATNDELLEPSIDVDARLELTDLDERFWAVLRQFAPFGPTNARPIFQSKGLSVVGRPRTVGRDGAHLKFDVCTPDNPGVRHQIIGFNLGEQIDVVERSSRHGSSLDILFSLDENVWRGARSLQLQARDLRPATTDERPHAPATSDVAA